MRITIFSIGTQGDVRPFVALGLGLQAAGHRVRIASGTTCADLIRGAGLEFAPLNADFLELMARDPGVLERGLNPVRLLTSARRHLLAMARDWADQGRAAAADAGLLIGNGMVAVLTASLGQALSVAHVETHLQPVTPAPDIPPMMLPPPRGWRPGWVNLALYQGLRVLTWQMFAPAYARVRSQLALPPLPWYGPYYERRRRLLLYGFSPQLVPPSPHWPAEVVVAGDWHWPQGRDWQPPAALQDFLAAAPSPPIYVGFGSMHNRDAAAFTGEVVAAIRAVGCRAVLATGWGGLSAVSGPDIQVIDQAPHDWLLPRVALAVHHGGAGTTAAAVRAGIPSVVVPHFGDQPFWAWRLQQLGVAPPAVTRKGLTAGDLAAAIDQARAPQMRARAAELGSRLRGEDGVARALAQLQSWGLLAPPR